MTRRVGIVGHTGYSGAELVRLLRSHPLAEPVLLEHRESSPAARYLDSSPLERLPCTEDAVRSAGLSIVFLATAPKISLDLAPRMLAAGARVVDLSGAFRLKCPERYAHWYKQVHPEPALLAEAAYGLPEFYRPEICQARLIANPGCYPTAANLAIRPLVENGLANRNSGIVCDAKSGVSGAGRKPSLATSFCEVTQNFSAYAVLEHRHVPEVLLNCGLTEGEFSFTAQLLPIERGILETIYFRGRPNLTASEIMDVYSRCYEGERFVRVYNPGSRPDLRDVARTNRCDLSVDFDERTGRGVIVSAIDNLGKGAAGQAIQNMNLLLGFPEAEGLL